MLILRRRTVSWTSKPFCAIAQDYARQGEALWQIFHVTDRHEHEWHYRGLAASLSELADTEMFESLRSQIATSNWSMRHSLPYAFTELGISMLSSVLTSEAAIQANVQILQAFSLGHREQIWRDYPSLTYGISSLRSDIPARLRRALQTVINNQRSSKLGAGYLFRFAVSEGFEPPVRCRTPVFEAGSFNHSDNSPWYRTTKVGKNLILP